MPCFSCPRTTKNAMSLTSMEEDHIFLSSHHPLKLSVLSFWEHTDYEF
jgi:hypothetical protein